MNYDERGIRNERTFVGEGISPTISQSECVRLGDYNVMQYLILCEIVVINNFLSY